MSNNILEKEVLVNIRENYNNIFAAERKVADFILKNPEKSVDLNVSELAKKSGVSDATVVRMCHRIGYKGYYQFRIALAQDIGKKQIIKTNLSELDDAVEKLLTEYAEDLRAIGKRIDSKVMWNCVNLVKKCNYVHLVAVGNTSPLAQYMGFRLGRLGIKATYNVAPEYFMNHINLADSNDIIIAISQSGTSKQVIQGLELGKEKGLKSIAITAFAQSPVSSLADYVLLSGGLEEDFNYYKGYAHLNETAVIDALLTFITNEDLIKSYQTDRLELILSEYKL